MSPTFTLCRRQRNFGGLIRFRALSFAWPISRSIMLTPISAPSPAIWPIAAKPPYVALKERLEKFPLPVHLMLGNHDDRANFLEVFNGPLEGGFVQHRLIQNGQHFLFLDTLKGGPSSAGLYDEPRRQWLKAALAEAKGAPVYIFMHHPPFNIHHPLMDLIPLEDGPGSATCLRATMCAISSSAMPTGPSAASGAEFPIQHCPASTINCPWSTARFPRSTAMSRRCIQ